TKPASQRISFDYVIRRNARFGVKRVCATRNAFQRSRWSRTTSTSIAIWERNCEDNPDAAQFSLAVEIAAVVSREAIWLQNPPELSNRPRLDFSGPLDHGRRQSDRRRHRLSKHRSPPSQITRVLRTR